LKKKKKLWRKEEKKEEKYRTHAHALDKLICMGYNIDLYVPEKAMPMRRIISLRFSSMYFSE
jgi:hypothetical protein